MALKTPTIGIISILYDKITEKIYNFYSAKLLSTQELASHMKAKSDEFLENGDSVLFSPPPPESNLLALL